MDEKKKSRTLGLCMIVKDEEENIVDCIKPLVDILDEIIVIDTGSRDNTKSLVKKMGAKVVDFPWKEDFSLARNESIRHSTTDYIIWLDADDRINEKSAQRLLQLKKRLSPLKDEAYYFIIQSISPVDGNTKFYQIRLFPRVKGIQFEGKIHESLNFSLKRMGIKTRYEDITIEHIGYQDKKRCFQKIERNLNILKEELEKEPENLVLHFHTARTLAGLERYREAILHLKKIVENPLIRKKEEEFYLQASIYMGKYYIDLNEYDKAFIIFEELSNDFSDRFLVHFFKGLCLFQLKDTKGAMNAIKKSINLPMKVQLLPFSSEQISFHQYFILGKCLLEIGDKKGAKEMFLKSINGYREEFKSIEELAILSLSEGLFDEAIQYYQDLIRRGIENDRIYINLGLAYKKKGFIEKSIMSLERALQMNPKRIEAILNLGHLFFEKKDYRKAEELFEKAIQLNSHIIDARLALSEIYFRTARIEELVDQCDFILKELSIPRDYIIESFQDIAFLYEKIGDTLIEEERINLSLMAYYVSFLIFPSKEILYKIDMIPGSRKRQREILKRLSQEISFKKETALNLL